MSEHKLGKYIKNLLIIFVFSGIVIGILLKNHAMDIVPMLKGAKIYDMVLVVLMMMFLRIIVGFNLTLLTRLNYPTYQFEQGILNSFVGLFFNMITPSASGGQFVQGYIFTKQGIPLSSAASILWSDFFMYQVTMVTFVFSLIVLRFRMFYQNYSQFFLVVIVGFLINAAVIVGLLALVKIPKFYYWVSTKGIEIAKKLRLIKDVEKAKERIANSVNQFAEESQNLAKHPKLVAILFFTNFVRLLVYFLTPYFCIKALNIEVAPGSIFNIITLSAFVMVVNALLPMPGSSGGTEATFVLMFSTLFTKAQASSIMIVWRFLTYYIMLVIGGLIFVYARLQKDVPPQKRIES